MAKRTGPKPRDFWSFVDTSGGLDACWPWIGKRDPHGYGRKTTPRPGPRRDLFAHRLVFEMAHGHLPPVVRHGCDNPPCCNPLHLLGGEHADNVADKLARGRQPRGAAHYNGAKTHCAHGHPYDEANTYHRPSGGRTCLACERARRARRLS